MSAKRQAINQSTTRRKEAGKPAGKLGKRARRLGLWSAGLLAVSFFGASSSFAQSPGSVLGDVATGVGYEPATPPAAEFVEKARPNVDGLEYKPLTAADRANHRKSGAAIDSIVSSLEGARAGNQQRATRVTATDQPEGGGAAPKQKKKSKGSVARR